jgi:methylated-DNA-protein-cysteine methyltransferase-like protein
VNGPWPDRIRAVIAGLSPGEVVSYGEVARRAGRPKAARSVGAFLAEHGGELPWWRVVRAGGALVAPKATEQARRLRAEGVEVRAGRVVAALPDR